MKMFRLHLIALTPTLSLAGEGGCPRLAWVLVIAALVTPARGAETPTVHLVPASDAPLAAMVLVAAGTREPVLLFDPQDQAATSRYLAAVTTPITCLVGSTTAAAERAALATAAGSACEVVADLPALARRLWPAATRAVLVPAARYGSLLRAAALAGTAGAALLPIDPVAPLPAEALQGWATERIYAIAGAETGIPSSVPAERVTVLGSPEAIAAEQIRALPAAPRTVVVTNPKDRQGRFAPSSLSLLAPLASATHGAPLVLVTDPTPDAVETAVAAFIAAHALSPTHIFLIGDELALRSHRVPDPVLQAGGPAAIGGGTEVRVELFSEIQHARPQDYAVGRLVAEDLAQGSALLARQLHRVAPAGGERVEVLSNADQVFSLGETISRTTVSELRNAGVAVKARYRDRVTQAAVQEALGRADVLIWEGHARDLTLEERGGIAVERTPPTVVLQGCYTLDRSDPFILFERGTQAIVATSAAIYSASGSAFARALFDALAYDEADLGIAVRNARNYLLAVTEMKKRRGHTDWTKTYRAALAFALWADPTARPRLAAPTPKLPPAVWRSTDHALQLTIPKARLAAATVGRYTAEPVPRAMLSGLILRDGAKPERHVKELFFTALPAADAATAACPPAPDWEVVSLFAPRTRTLSVLARPPAADRVVAGVAAGVFTLRLVDGAAKCLRPPLP